MSHIALYRAWRPQLFQDIVGQNHITRTLRNALKEGRFSHAYLFSGPRGTGKTSAAKILAKAVNCEQAHSDGEPCNQCSACLRIAENAVMDVVEIDAASNRGVEEIRDIRDKVKYAPTEVRYKVYIIDEVHMLTTEAFNALLKTLEEPPQHVLFVLATTEPNRIPPTIISRCQRFDFRRVSLQEQIRRIEYICKEENISADTDALQYIARLSGGGMRDALSLLDQIISFSGDRMTYEQVVEVTGGIASDQFTAMAAALYKRDVGAVLELVEAWLLEGKHIENSLESLIQYFRDLLLLKMVPDTAEAMTEQIVDAEGVKQIAEQFARDELFQIIDILNHYGNEMKYASHPQTIFEIALMKICSRGGEASKGPAGNHTHDAAPQAAQDGQRAEHGNAGTGSRDDSAGRIAQLAARIEALERQIQVLAQGRPMSTNTPKAASATGQYSSHPTSSNQPASDQTGSEHAGSNKRATPETKAPLVKRTGGSPANVRLQDYVDKHDAAAFAEIQGKWNQVLQTVKERKITVHAWLVDGEPIAYTSGKLLVAFKNTIHRETTEKPANKQLIEEVMQEIISKPIQLNTVMLKDWNAIRADKTNQDEIPEPLELEPEHAEPASKQPEWVDEAIRLFGEDLVEVKANDD